MTGLEDQTRPMEDTAGKPALKRQGAGIGTRFAARCLGALARVLSGNRAGLDRPGAKGGTTVFLVPVEDVFSLAARERDGVQLALPADPALDRLAQFLSAAGSAVERRNSPLSPTGAPVAMPVALPGTPAAGAFPAIAVGAVLAGIVGGGGVIRPLGVAAKRVWRLDPGAGVPINLALSPVGVVQGKAMPATAPLPAVVAALEFAADAAGAERLPTFGQKRHGLRAYRLAMSALALVAEPYLAWRARKGKEDPDRKDERFGRASSPPPQGRTGWVHAASVGESVSILPLIKRLLDFEEIDNLVVTTGTVTSAQIMGARLPAGAVHRYVPLDCPSFVAGFIDNWRPEFAIFVESEIWPNMYAALKTRHIPTAIVNGRMSARSFEGWQRHFGFISSVLASTEICIAQNDTYAMRYAQLGAPNVVALGNIKFDSPPLPAATGDLERLGELTKMRPVWLAASTHPGEEEAIADVHVSMREKYPDLLTILVPRHPERGEEVATLLEDRWLATARRSSGAEPRAMVDVYVADTIGELGLFYRLCPFAFIGGSLTGIGGHNPVEAANLDCAVIHGPHVHNFRDMFETFDMAGAAIEVADAGQLFARVDQLTATPALAKTMAAAGREVLGVNLGATDRAVAALAPIIALRQAGDG